MSMDLKRMYYEIKKYIDIVDFSKLWNGFQPLKFALYNDNECFYDGNYINKTDEFLANTSILYNGKWIAIWYVSEYIDPIILASKIIHEMFHGFQMINNESRFIDELDALYKYKYDEINHGLKLMENKLIHDLVNEFDLSKYNELLEIKKYRYTNYAFEYYYESSIEQIEGTANYVELISLKQLSDTLFRKKLTQMKEEIIDKNQLFPIRPICYNTGALLLLIINENNIKFDLGFSSTPFSVFMLSDIEKKEISLDCDVKELIENYYLKAIELINKAIKQNDIVSDEPSKILGVNVYNAIYYKNYIISTFFVMYGSEDAKKIEYGNFVIETNEYKILTRIYRV